MEMTRRRRTRIAPGLAFAALALAGSTGTSFGQNAIDPYRPEQAPYNAYTEPSLPNNLALPNSAREARQYSDNADGFGLGSRYNTFDRYLNDSGSGYGSSRRSAGPGVPYYDAYRRDSSFNRPYTPNEKADRLFFERQATADRNEIERDRLYRAAVRERDPVKRDQFLRRLARLNSSRGAEPDAVDDRAAAGTAETPRSTPRASGADRDARGVNSSAAPSSRTSSPSMRTPPASGRDLRDVRVPARRPPLPSETRARDRAVERPAARPRVPASATPSTPAGTAPAASTPTTTSAPSAPATPG